MKNKIKEFAKKQGIEYCGFTKAEGKTAIVFLFPYFSKYEKNSNISIYTYAKDYHIVIKDYLTKICSYIKEMVPDFNYKIYSDISPYNDIDLAYRAGLGIIGKNHLLINKKYGSYVFIGYIITETIFDIDFPLSGKCLNCQKCVKACPSGTLSTADFSKCLSSVTQKKGELTDTEKALIRENGYAFGCDICQTVCPMNLNVTTPISEFKENLQTKINSKDFIGLSNKTFREHYKEKAFSWRGKQVLLRNLSLLENGAENPQE